jgi:hypothetical protein
MLASSACNKVDVSYGEEGLKPLEQMQMFRLNGGTCANTVVFPKDGHVALRGVTPTGRTGWMISLAEIWYSLKRGWHSVKAAGSTAGSTSQFVAEQLHCISAHVCHNCAANWTGGAKGCYHVDIDGSIVVATRTCLNMYASSCTVTRLVLVGAGCRFLH